MKFYEHLIGFFELFGKPKEVTRSLDINKDFTDLVKYLKKYAARISSCHNEVDVDRGTIYTYEKENSAQSYSFTVYHIGNWAKNIKIYAKCSGANYTIKSYFEDIQKKVKDYLPESKNNYENKTFSINYSLLNLRSLVDELEKEINILKITPTKDNLNTIKSIKEEINNKVNDMAPLEKERFIKPLSTIELYINTIDSQLTSSATVMILKQFIESYIAQMQTSINEINSAM